MGCSGHESAQIAAALTINEGKIGHILIIEMAHMF